MPEGLIGPRLVRDKGAVGAVWHRFQTGSPHRFLICLCVYARRQAGAARCVRRS